MSEQRTDHECLKEDVLDLAGTCLEYFRSLQEIQIGRRRNDPQHVQAGVARAKKAQADLEEIIETLEEEVESHGPDE